MASRKVSCARLRLQLVPPNGQHLVRREFSTFNDFFFSKKIKGETESNLELQESKMKVKAKELKGVKEEDQKVRLRELAKYRTKQATELLYKHVDGLWTDAKKVYADAEEKIATAKAEVKDGFLLKPTFGFSSVSPKVSLAFNEMNETKPIDILKKGCSSIEVSTILKDDLEEEDSDEQYHLMSGTLNVAVLGKNFVLFASSRSGSETKTMVENTKKVSSIGGRLIVMGNGEQLMFDSLRSILKRNENILGYGSLDIESFAYKVKYIMSIRKENHPKPPSHYNFKFIVGSIESGRPRVFMYDGVDDSIVELLDTFFVGYEKVRTESFFNTLVSLTGYPAEELPYEKSLQFLKASIYRASKFSTKADGNIMIMKATSEGVELVYDDSAENLVLGLDQWVCEKLETPGAIIED